MTEVDDTAAVKDNLEHAITELLQERKELLALFCQVAGVGEEAKVEVRQRVLQRLCQLLMDYASLWQFEIYDLLLQSREEHPQAVRELEGGQALIVEASGVAVDFNDRYDASDHLLDMSDLDRQLSLLGESLAIRFDAEDRVISAL